MLLDNMPGKKGKEYSGDLLFSLLRDLVKANVKYSVTRKKLFLINLKY